MKKPVIEVDGVAENETDQFPHAHSGSISAISPKSSSMCTMMRLKFWKGQCHRITKSRCINLRPADGFPLSQRKARRREQTGAERVVRPSIKDLMTGVREYRCAVPYLDKTRSTMMIWVDG
jgi:hypothetical protein